MSKAMFCGIRTLIPTFPDQNALVVKARLADFVVPVDDSSYFAVL